MRGGLSGGVTETKRIRESVKGKGKVSEIASSFVEKVKTLIFSNKDLKKLESAVDKLDKLCRMDFNQFLIKRETMIKDLDNIWRVTNSHLDPDEPIFGRDREIELILDMILEVPYGGFVHRALDDPNLEQGKGEGSISYFDRIFQTSKIRGIPGDTMSIQTAKKGDVPEQSKNIVSTVTTIAEPYSISNWELAVIPIVGIGGIGKTTVAKIIYNHERVEGNFSLEAWVSVSENDVAKKIMQALLCSFGGSITENLETAARSLIKIITNNRFLLILDNVSDRTECRWSTLHAVLSNGGVGSVVVVTTQSRSIAETMGTLPVVTLDVLQPKSFWKLFQNYAFGGFKFRDFNDQWLRSEQEELKKIGKQIAEKLHGLPLAGKVIGTLLSTRLQKEFWDDICGNDWWNIEGAREEILSSIGVGYNSLDPKLKQCFAFCSIFPKQYVFEMERLVQMWISQGFIQPSQVEICTLDKEEIILEDIGRKWFGELVDKSLFQPTLSDGKYLMQDLMRELAIAVSSNKFCFIKSHDRHLPSLAEHCGIDCDNLEVEQNYKDSTRVRTVILFGNWTNCSDKSICNIFAKCNGLRVLDLSHIVLETNEPINVFCKLSHLRFVNLSFTGIKSISDKFCALYHLEVLDLRGCNFEKLPEGMNQLINLRHLYASSHTISLISGIGKLTKLQELEEFCIGDRTGYRITELMDMNNLSGHLLLSNLNNVSSKEEAAKSQLDKKVYLKSLELRFEDNDHGPRTEVKMMVLDALKPAHTLEILKVDGCRCKSLPSWLLSPNHGLHLLMFLVLL